ncbi:MAG TPA: hypothetical protein VD966_10130 [Pyrinomonadaceae bacterium]|nr:hypothetical protein [Pyrinomonadaceae bacterium]
MSVIGRLDEQTDAILIAPLDRKSKRELTANEREDGERSKTAAEAPIQIENSKDNRTKENEMPVWML